jgi:RND family efflux transporter MFP subunit
MCVRHYLQKPHGSPRKDCLIMKSRRGIHLLSFVILFCLLYVGYRSYESQMTAASLHQETLENAVQPVGVIYAKPAEPNETVTLPGNIQAWYEAPIYAQVSGYVKMWYKDYGAEVKKGDVLAEINAPALDAQYKQAQADLAAERTNYALAELTAKRFVAMRKKHAVSEQAISVEVAKAKAQAAKVRAAEQNVRNFEALIQFKTIVAPYDGVVTVRNINVGDYVNKEGTISTPGVISNLFTVADTSMMRLFVNVPETFGPFLKPGLTAEVTVPQFPKRHFTAKFLTVARGFDVSTRTAITEFTMTNEDRALWPGSYATVRLTAPVEQNILTIPSTAMVFQENGTEVAVVTDDDRIQFKPIVVGRILDAAVEVTEGISASDRIINNPSAALLEGNQVRVVSPAPGYDVVAQKVFGAKNEPSIPETPTSKDQSSQ